ncbi:glycoside hydrolase family 127 protein [Terrimonas sp. NA20]|uniref:Glycoside hydrolase family 127 protein n=1 Tax=Terrimonas ginsenosidimutans TaxID=2908004 RepID=A0ABS9KNL7_9BACT|nr:beta-L-arabinofuranosidase domain-containing protein [Terrimonas ginsenosidimutans]MCG2613875.1 glycoside hydrolase family 127 protein [Terrimonas ginsenosidimutans]
MMFAIKRIGSIFIAGIISVAGNSQTNIHFNRAPLQPGAHIQLPLGSIKAKGWLLHQLELQRDGATGHAEELYPGKNDLGKDADWLGGDGTSWEKAPYYLKGLIALAYTLDDSTLKSRAQKWIDHTLDHQQENGLFGPVKMKDWWPRMPFMYALQSYYEATADKRVIPFLSKYFKYEFAALDQDPLRDWGRSRAADNMEMVLWLYNQTGEKFLLKLAEKLKTQAYPWADIHQKNQFFYNGSDFHTRHMVSVGQALKFPAIYSQLDSSSYYRDAMKKGIAYLLRDHGQPQGLASGTEMAAGRSSVQGVETCTVVEWMQSLETAYRILHDAELGDQLEKIAFNALPAQFNRDFKNHSYYTLPNQVQSLPGPHGFNQDYGNGIVPGAYSGFPCCRYNMHMGWPYLVKNSWSATPDGGLAATIYAPMEVSAIVAKNVKLKIDEETNYPFGEQIRLHFSLSRPASFPVYLRVPGWCNDPVIAINGKALRDIKSGEIVKINRKWNDKDVVVLNFPMNVSIQPQVNNGVSIERGSLVYALKIKEDVKIGREFALKGFFETEITPGSPWNYGLLLSPGNTGDIKVEKAAMPVNPFVQETTPVTLKVQGKRIPAWTIDYNNTAAMEVPFSPVTSTEQTEEITLVPFGAESLRLSIFPTIGTPAFETRYYQQSFDDNTSTGWIMYGGGWYCKEEKLHVVANEDGGSGPGSKIIQTGTKFSDFEYTADISINAGGGDAGLLFRVTDAAVGADLYKGYYLGFNAETGTIQLGKVSNKQWIMISSVKYPLALNKTFKVKLVAVDDRFEVFMDDSKETVLTATDRHYGSGSIGLRAYKALMTVDNILVKAVKP